MADPLTDCDVVVVGAGAAGIAAARALGAAGAKALLVEARDRVGGRAHTLRRNVPAPLDLGCEWLHSGDVNPLVPVAEGLGLAVDRSRPDWGGHVGRHLGREEHRAFQAASGRFWNRLDEEAERGGPDRPAAELLDPGGRWNPLIDAISSYYNGIELREVSVVDLGRYRDTGVNWRVAEGYGTLFERAAQGLDVALGCRASLIDHSGAVLRVETDRGPIRAARAVVTLPTNVIASGGVRFRPDLPDKREAAAALPLGYANKLWFTVSPEADLPSGHLYGTADRVETISFDLRPRGRPLVEGYLGGSFARDLEREGDRGFEAQARAQLGHMLGHDVQRHLSFLRATAWAGDPFSLGAYSHARPGFADRRAVLARPVDERLFFAGEACSPHFFSTAHGAWETGLAAAAAVLGARDGKPVRNLKGGAAIASR